ERESMLELMAHGIRASDIGRRLRNIDSMDFGSRKFLAQCQSDTARTGAHINNAQFLGRLTTLSALLTRESQDSLDEMFSFRARNQDAGGHDQVHAPEFLMSGNVLRGHTAGAFSESSVIAGLLV